MTSGKTFATILIYGFCVGCGSAANTHFKLSPTSTFDDATDTLKDEEACDVSSEYACSKMGASGTAVGGSFAYNSLYTRCTQSADGLVIEARNRFDEYATFSASISFYKLASPSGSYECIGTEYSQTTPTYILKEGYCNVLFTVHNTSFAASSDEPCSVTITGSSPVKGTVTCEILSADPYYLSIDESSTFECSP